MNFYDNPVVAQLPKHLFRYIVSQNYSRYTPIDQAVWRYVMRQNYAYLRDIAYYPYIPGLKKAGLSIEFIPDLQQMNDALKKIGWGAVTVDGFIPPSAFMEFQANRVLVIAADIRNIEHITYTPAPDIIHESSGHAPIIGEPEYADYLQYFGEVGTKALSSGRDKELYEAIRALSIVKEKENVTNQEIELAEKHFEEISSNMGEPSEMALLSRLHWWTVEYGLIGNLDFPKIYGAGLLSSIGESASCMRAQVKKLDYTIDAINFSYDITKPQPQLFVVPDFQRAYEVLEDFSSNMAYRKGGEKSIKKAIDSQIVCTATYSSGIQVSGVFVDFSESEEFIGIRTSGPTSLAFEGKELSGHDKRYHKDGFSSPVGNVLNSTKALEDFTRDDLRKFGIEIGKHVSIKFESGIILDAKVNSWNFQGSKLILISFSECTMKDSKNNILFEPSWGMFDMAIGERIVSVFAGAADKEAYEDFFNHGVQEEGKVSYTSRQLDLHEVYQAIRNARKVKPSEEMLLGQLGLLNSEYPDCWLAAVEIYELAQHYQFVALKKQTLSFIISQISLFPELEKLINDGLNLADDNKIELTLQ